MEEKNFKNLKKFKFDYSWVIIAICFLTVATSLGLCSSGRTMYLTAITDALNLKRGAFLLNDTCRFVTIAMQFVIKSANTDKREILKSKELTETV